MMRALLLSRRPVSRIPLPFLVHQHVPVTSTGCVIAHLMAGFPMPHDVGEAECVVRLRRIVRDKVDLFRVYTGLVTTVDDDDTL